VKSKLPLLPRATIFKTGVGQFCALRVGQSCALSSNRESFDVSGSKKLFEWQQVENEEPVIHTKSTREHPLSEPEIARRVKVPDYAGRLPAGIRRFTQPSAIQDAEHLSFLQGGGHGGSHPHLVHAFLSAERGERPALPDAETSANWTMVGLCAHDSAMRGGERVTIPTS